MAGNYEIIGQDPGIEALSSTRSRDVMNVAVETKPSAIGFEFRLPLKGYNIAAAQSKAADYAGKLETIMGSDLIAGMSYEQIPDGSGRLRDYMDIYVQTPDGTATTVFQHLLSTLTWDAISGQVIDLVNELYAIQNS